MKKSTFKKPEVTKRNERFSEKVTTKIWQETPSPDNPYLADQAACHGYNLIELMQSRSYAEVLYLLFKGELPSKAKSQLLEKFMIAFCNPGPRHPAVRASMNAAVSGTNPVHLLPISLSVLSGSQGGADEVIASMRFLRKQIKNDPEEVASNLLSAKCSEQYRVAPGFGNQFNGVAPLLEHLAKELVQEKAADNALVWAADFVKTIRKSNQGWLLTGLAAAVMIDLGFTPNAGACLFQIACAPGIAAHGLEMSGKAITQMPFVSDENYHYTELIDE